MHAAGLLGQWFLKENLKWRTQPVSGEEGHSTILLVHTRIFTRLILILTGAHDYEAMGSWYWCVVFTHIFCGFNWGQSYLATPQNCTIMRRNSLFGFIQFAYFCFRSIKRRGWKKRVFFFNLLSKVRHKKQLFEKLRETFWEISSNLWKALVPGVLSGDRGNWG